MVVRISWFLMRVEGKGTDRRAAGLPKLYKIKLIPPDSRFHNTPVGLTGPLFMRLDNFGKLESLIAGPLGNLQNMVKVMGETKLAFQASSTVREASQNELGLIISQIKI